MRAAALAVLTTLLSTAALAQDDEVNVQVNGAGVNMGASVNVRGDGVDMQAGSTTGGAGMSVRVNQQGARQRPQSTAVTATARGRAQVATVVVPAAQVVVAPAPVVVRDCGTGNDPGCSMARNGEYAMDAETFRGFLASLRSNPNELSRQEICETMLGTRFLTAAQLGQVLDLFQNEILRLEVARTAAPKVVNPGHALGHAAKWHNSISAQEYTELMAQQR